MVPTAVTDWLRTDFPSPQVDPVWLQDCYAWLTDTEGDGPKYTSTQEIIDGIRSQLLFSSLSDSMVPNTGFPSNILEMNGTRLSKKPILAEIVQIEEIGISALSLHKTMEARFERTAAGETEEGDPIEEDGLGEVGGKIPKYQRSLLKLHLSDGSVTVPAIEYRPIRELELGVTKLGYKLQLKDVLVRGGIVFLEPSTITLLGHWDAELDEMQGEILARSLRFRLGRPEPEPQPQPPPHPNPEEQEMPPATRPTIPLPSRASLNGTAPPPPLNNPRPALRDVTADLPPLARPDAHIHDDDNNMPHRRKLPHRSSLSSEAGGGGGLVFPSTRQSTQETLIQLTQSRKLGSEGPSKSNATPPSEATLVHQTQSSYFASTSQGLTQADVQAVQDILRLTPTRATGTIVSDSLEGILKANEIWSASLRSDPPEAQKGKGKARDPEPHDDAIDLSDDKADLSSEFGDTSMDASFLQALDEVERQASQSLGPPSQSGDHHEADVITIESDEEDKENVPVPTRHVRRRLGGAASPMRSSQAMDVKDLGMIEISDSD